MSDKRIEIRYYDQHLRRTRRPAEAFDGDENTATTRFVATYQFKIRDDALIVMLGNVVFHFFHPAALLNHLDYIANVLHRRRDASKPLKLGEISESERRAILEILLATVIGAGVAGRENGLTIVTWYSASLKDQLGCANPKMPSGQDLHQRLERKVNSILDDHA